MFLETTSAKLLFAVIIVAMLIVFSCQYGYMDCSRLQAMLDKRPDVDSGDGAGNSAGDSEGFDPSPYADYSSDLYQPGINDERDDELNIEEVPWQEAIDTLGLDQSVIDSHKAFVNDSSRTTTTASNVPTREYDEDVVPWVGLPRNRYKVLVGSTARVTPSEYSDQLPTYSPFLLA